MQNESYIVRLMPPSKWTGALPYMREKCLLIPGGNVLECFFVFEIQLDPVQHSFIVTACLMDINMDDAAALLHFVFLQRVIHSRKHIRNFVPMGCLED